ncbi:MAG TPA: GyrI-like domain-containing protein [Blastococcus sp.]|jgi:hypothetical protein|nr:GyrI-like domain-containing protein [Blastococcus sp.]
MSVITIDLRRELSALYSARRAPSFVDVPELSFLMVDGHGDPNTDPAYADAIQALYSLAYTIRFALKRGPAAVDAPVMPLEGLWWAPDMAAFSAGDKSAWDWTMMIAVPVQVTEEVVSDARRAAAGKRPLAAIDQVRLERFAEGRCAQVLHVGPYSAEGPTIAGLHAFITANGYALAGKHHEIYLGDPRRSAPEKLRTIVRQPVAQRS